MKRARLALDVLCQLGPRRAAEIALYRIGLASGHYKRLTPFQGRRADPPAQINQSICPPAPSREALAAVIGSGAPELLAEAEEITQGRVRLFGGAPIPLNLVPAGDPRHWTDYETGRAPWGVKDVKFIWEPARFGWAVTLARAFQLTGSDIYTQSFSRLAEAFFQANPANMGPNWASGQEVALRLICLAFAATVFGTKTPVSAARLAEHAMRIPPTLVYARAQNNNHLLSEAVGLYSAAALLPNHPQANTWRKTGWRWLNHCFQHQIAPDGAYIQHSTNYHRLMLQLALWARCVAHRQGQMLPPESQAKLAAATQWLLERLDPVSGRVPNLGHNDGAYILPLASGGYSDYRPVAQAASRAFLGSPFLPPGPWDEMSLWLGDLAPDETRTHTITLDPQPHLILRSRESWANLRAVQHTTRPGQADLLHVDLWWRGEAVTLDPGTFQYNAAPPWENALAGTAVHNTVTVGNQDQMRRAGRFLWLDWPKVYIYNLPAGDRKLAAFHEGYVRRFKVIHRREVSQEGKNAWLVVDKLLPSGRPGLANMTLHWLLPDHPWQLTGQTLTLETPNGPVQFTIAADRSELPPEIQLIRAGQTLVGLPTDSPIFGWYSPTYSVKIPALALRFTWRAIPPLEISTRIQLGVI